MMASNKKSNYYGLLLVLVMFVSVLALFTSNPETTGFVVREQDNLAEISNQNNIEINENNNIGNSCVGNIPHDSCSNTKPLYCDDGSLIYKCTECGCNEGETCTEFGTCAALERCADGSIYGECSFLNGKFCDNGNLVFNCNLCGCDEGYSCSDNKCVRE